MRVVLVLVVALVGARASARTVQVGFVNAAHDQAQGRRAIEEMRRATVSRGIAVVGLGPLQAALEEPLAEGALARVADFMRRARDAYASFALESALRHLESAESVLGTLEPDASVVQALSELNVLVGVIHLEGGDVAAAEVAFRLAHKLAPERTSLDPASYRPKAVALYAKAVQPSRTPVPLTVSTEPPGAALWVDGRVAGVAPLSIDLPSGAHYLTASLEGYGSRTVKEVVRSSQPNITSISLVLLPPEERIRQVRARLRGQPEPGAWARAGALLGRLTALDRLVFVRDHAQKGLEAGVYEVSSGRLSAFVPAVVATVPPLISQTAEAPRPQEVPSPRSPPEPRPWYRRWWALAAGAGLAVAASITIVLVTRDPGYRVDELCAGTTCAP